eukprot:TRINITY_DN121083_c0_g1_i1.p2 TRINITY_DN121083_c0_g1~~TRINITY_DN121083_c0_g1_i1.p2  ORF type:complete len:100 (-),score=6.15 TRINITY_DN121083_c0_g1_i1:406-705(-)
MKVVICTLTGYTFPIEVESTDTVEKIRLKIMEVKGTSPAQQKISFQKNPLGPENDEKTLEEGFNIFMKFVLSANMQIFVDVSRFTLMSILFALLAIQGV